MPNNEWTRPSETSPLPTNEQTGLPPTEPQQEQTAPGIFEIGESEEDQRPGASLATWTEDDGKADHSPLDLPMIVWLRGDESWYPEFDLDADAVMQRLGIKRSRLTQISGKELRVGRIRMDRYIRPIYRSSDVEQYSNWTRATASHQRSSSAIKEAVDALQSQGSQIAQVVEAANHSFKLAIESGLADKVRDAAAEALTSLQTQINDMDQRLQDSALLLQVNVVESQKKLASSIERHASIAVTQANTSDIRLDAIETASAATVLRLSELSDKLERLWGQQSQIERYLGQHIQLMQTIAEKLDEKKATFKRRRSGPIKKSPTNIKPQAIAPKFKKRRTK